jgi:hypothetical protein
LQRCGFNIMTVINEEFEPFEPTGSGAPRVIFSARKQ